MLMQAPLHSCMSCRGAPVPRAMACRCEHARARRSAHATVAVSECSFGAMQYGAGIRPVSDAVHHFSLSIWHVSREPLCIHRWRSLLACSQRSQSGHSKQACCWSASCRCPTYHLCEGIQLALACPCCMTAPNLQNLIKYHVEACRALASRWGVNLQGAFSQRGAKALTTEQLQRLKNCAAAISMGQPWQAWQQEQHRKLSAQAV